MATNKRYTLTDLANLASVTPRTVRYYVAQGLLASPGQPGPGAKYTREHLARILLIRRLQREHLSLGEIRRRLETMGEDELLAATADAPREPTSALEYVRAALSAMRTPAPGDASALPLPTLPLPTPPLPRPTPGEVHQEREPASAPTPHIGRSQWDRVALTPDVEIHIRRPLDRRIQKRVDRLIAIARELLEEEQS